MVNVIFAVTCIFLVVAFALLTLAFLLRAACYILDEPVPELGYCLIISLLQVLLGGIAIVLVQGLVVILGLAISLPPESAFLVAQFVGIPIKMAVCAAIYAKMLSVSFAKGLGLYLVQAIIFALLMVVAVFIGGLIGPILAS